MTDDTKKLETIKTVEPPRAVRSAAVDFSAGAEDTTVVDKKAENIKRQRFYIGEQLKALRKNYKISQEELSTLSGLGRSVIANIEGDRTAVKLDHLNKLDNGFCLFFEEIGQEHTKGQFKDYLMTTSSFPFSEKEILEKIVTNPQIREQVIDGKLIPAGTRMHRYDFVEKKDREKLTRVHKDNFEKARIWNLYKKLSKTDQQRIMERMEHIISMYEEETNIPTKVIPIINQTSCGNPIEAIQNPDDTIETNELKATFALRVVGDSMSPLINDGDIILIKQTNEIEIGEIGIFDINETGFSNDYGITCKMLKRTTNGMYTLNPLNASYDAIFVGNDKGDVKVIGKYLGRHTE